jgi:hypothetical protein
MRSISLVLFMSVSAIATTALADPCSKTVTAGYYSAGVDSDEPYLLSSKPSLVSDGALSCGDFTYEVTSFTEISSQGKYGERGYGDEIDLKLIYDHVVATPLGPVQLEASSAYWKVTRFDRPDANLNFYVEGARAFTFGKVTVTPFVRATQWIGIGNFPTDSFVRPGMRIAFPISEKISVNAEITKSFDFTERLYPSYATVTVTRDFGKGWKGSLIVQPNETMRSVFGLSLAKTW